MMNIDKSAVGPELANRLLFELAVEVTPSMDFAAGRTGHTRSICYFTGGSIRGPELEAEILPGGGDWAAFTAPDTLSIDVRMVARATTGDLIYVIYHGLWKTLQPNFDKIFGANGYDHYRPEEHYLRVAARFETASKKFGAFNDILAVGVGELTPSLGVRYDFYQIL